MAQNAQHPLPERAQRVPQAAIGAPGARCHSDGLARRAVDGGHLSHNVEGMALFLRSPYAIALQGV